MESVGQSCFNL